jgi:hypothetical protein
LGFFFLQQRRDGIAGLARDRLLGTADVAADIDVLKCGERVGSGGNRVLDLTRHGRSAVVHRVAVDIRVIVVKVSVRHAIFLKRRQANFVPIKRPHDNKAGSFIAQPHVRPTGVPHIVNSETPGVGGIDALHSRHQARVAAGLEIWTLPMEHVVQLLVRDL